MKKVTTILAAILLMAVGATAQKLSYSAVVRNSANELVANENITVAVSIANSSGGAEVYGETHSATTNANGLVTLTIGEGTGATGSLADVTWKTAFITTTYTLSSGTVTNTVPVNAVPYALYADNISADGLVSAIASLTDEQKAAVLAALGVSGGGSETFTCGTSKMRDGNGNEYETVLIGRQCWTKTNLRATKKADGGDIDNGGSNYSRTEPYYYDYSSSSIPLAERGYLYNWAAANVICPAGWHLPSDAEWTTMEQTQTTMDVTGTGSRGDHAGKLAGGNAWDISSAPNAPGNMSYSERNASGFGAVPAGYCTDWVSFSGAGDYAQFWTSTGYGSGSAYIRYLYYDSEKVGRYTGNDQSSGFSVRCLKDVSGDEPGGGGGGGSETFSCGVDKMIIGEGADRQEYETVQIGTQCWTKTNLRTTKKADGGDIADGGSNTSVTEPYYYDNSSSSIPLADRGYLYNWPAAMVACPTGWHLPSDAEWNTMEATVSGSEWQTSYETANGNYRGSHAGKLAGGDKWETSSTSGTPGDYGNADRNVSGFSAVPAGSCNGSSFYNAGNVAYFWNATQSASNTSRAYDRVLYYDNVGVFRNDGNTKNYGLSVRCLRD